MPVAVRSHYLRDMDMKNALREPGTLTLAAVAIDPAKQTKGVRR